MINKLRHAITAGFAVAGVWVALLVGAAILMEGFWAIWGLVQGHRYDVAMRTAFDIYLLAIWTGFLPNYALRFMHVRALPIYIVTGVGSALLASYTLFTAMRFGIPVAFCCLQNPPLPDLLWLTFTDGRHTVSGFLETNGYAPIAVFAAPGLFWGLVTWRLFRPSITPQ